MKELQRQVQRAQWKLNAQQFMRTFIWTLFAAFVVAAAGIASRKIWVIPANSEMWLWSWFGGALAAGIVGALVWTYLRRYRQLDAAIELDRRFGLKERVSSSLALTPAEAETPVGQALIADALRRVERIEVSEQFRLRATWWNLVPLLPAIAVFSLAVFVPDAQPSKQANASPTQVTIKRVRKSAEVLKKKVAERRKQAAEAGLDEAGELFDKLEKGVEQLAKKDQVDRKQALVELSDLAEELKKRRDDMGDREDLKHQLNKLGNLQPGPADRLARAMKQGDFEKAINEMKSLQAKIRDGQLSEEDQQKLAQQMEQMGQKLAEMAQAHEQAKRDLQNEIERMKQSGDLAKAEQLQQQLDQLNMRNQQSNRMSQMAQQLQQAAEKMNAGESAEAAAQLEELAGMVEDMQQQMDELEMLNDALDEIAQAKSSMGCKKCMGAGCEFCQGMGAFDGRQPGGRGMGEGQGQGDRPEQETDSQFYDSRVRAEVKRNARGVVVGTATGPNVAGDVLEEVKSALENAEGDDDDPLTGQRLPKPQRVQVQQYFDSIRGEESP